ncbi:transglutaminase domain-containing protein [uncultured Flavobacterium sp.]|uniref:transglutaminase domain-containing protein n=1 Tax=uncultured Flavobacterium sp. TaxID=165435 RepID=UPI0030ECF82F|tara:strand:+ start:16717 stop:17868 length:1152 start_codon:yes stop_codon:yes gene_type:complete
MKNCYLFTILLLSLVSFAQSKPQYLLIDEQISKMPVRYSNSTDNIAHYINSNFKTADDKIRAVFYWTASNIVYDIDNMFTQSHIESSEDRIINTLRTRKGICSNYTEIFNDIAIKVGVNTVIVSGYTKQGGKISSLSHAWCASEINGKWFVFDPTWGAGYIDKGRFVKKIDDNYYKVEPEKIIKSHMPYDYMWQFLNYPINNKDFYEGNAQTNKSQKPFDYKYQILKWESLPEYDRLISSSKRIEESGIGNKMILNSLLYNKKKIEYLNQKKEVNELTSVFELYQEGVTELNKFIAYRNRQFRPLNSDDELQRMILSPYNKLLICKESLRKLDNGSEKNRANINSLKKSLDAALRMTNEHKSFVMQYLSKSRNVRETLFFKQT